MYRWIWRHLPGNWAAKLAGCLALFVGVVALLFYVVFPWVDPKLPWNDAGVNRDAAPTVVVLHAAPAARPVRPAGGRAGGGR
jgi:hypothetical protein